MHVGLFIELLTTGEDEVPELRTKGLLLSISRIILKNI